MYRQLTRTSKRNKAIAALANRHVSRAAYDRFVPTEIERHYVPDLEIHDASASSDIFVDEPLPQNNVDVTMDNSTASASTGMTTSVHEDLPRATIGLNLPSSPLQLSPPHYCPHCNAKKFANESLHFCCDNGDVKIATNEYPPELQELFTAQGEEEEHFRTYARMYNNLFAFSSIGGRFDAHTHKGIYVFKVHGQIYHFVPDLLPNNGKPRYLQLYFYDGAHEVLNRKQSFTQVKEAVLGKLIEVTKRNPYAQFFRSLREIDVADNTTISLNTTTVPDQRVYNAPTSSEVAVIWPDSTSSSESSSPHILVCGKSNESHRIEHYYGCYDPLQYPLLFPYGDCGWSQGLKKFSFGGRQQLNTEVDPIMSSTMHSATDVIAEEENRSKRCNTRASRFISPREYYAYKLQIRPNNMLLRAGRCFQQYIVDMYVKIENTRLDYFRNHQDTIRAELYQGVLDSLDSGETIAANIGRRVILPATYLGGPRDMKKRYFNAMALVQKFGKPDLFVTMTCNANWPEITAELSPGEKSQDRPDITARIFRAKLLAMKDQIMKKHYFGKVSAMICEFQKRGLPHAHFLLILSPENKIKSPAQYDQFVSAEIPSPDNASLRKSVLKHMMHGPCGDLDVDCACMRAEGPIKVCKNKFPKKFSDETTTNKDGYHLYSCRNDGQTAKIRGHYLDNRWVVPHNPYLMSLFDCHINVEICSTIKAVKYLYKYVYKGHDRVRYNIKHDDGADIDEIEQYQSGRWVSPCEAAWRIFSFDLFEMSSSVLPLPLHLPNMQTVRLQPHERLQSVVNDDSR